MTFPVQIVTPEGERFHGEAEMVRLRTMDGDLGIKARHVDLVTALGMGECIVQISDSDRRSAACIGGVLAMMKGSLRIAATTFEWAEDIDVERCRRNIAQAESDPSVTAKKRAKRAQVRLAVAEKTKQN